jgi:hypothetical protein
VAHQKIGEIVLNYEEEAELEHLRYRYEQSSAKNAQLAHDLANARIVLDDTQGALTDQKEWADWLRKELSLTRDLLDGLHNTGQGMRKEITILYTSLKNHMTKEQFDEVLEVTNHALDMHNNELGE